MKKETKNPLLAYEKPVSKEIKVRIPASICTQSNPWTEDGTEGLTGSEDDL